MGSRYKTQMKTQTESKRGTTYDVLRMTSEFLSSQILGFSS